MKKTAFFCSLATVFLILFDQCAKILVYTFVKVNDKVLNATNCLHIHPVLNEEVKNAFLPIADSSSMNIKTLLLTRSVIIFFCFIIFIVGIYLIHKFIFWDTNTKKYSMLSCTVLCFYLAGAVCSLFFDQLIWGGSLDFLCIARERIQIYSYPKVYSVPWHWVIFDIKDIYLWLATILFLIRIILWIVEFLKYDKNNPEQLKINFGTPYII